MKPEARKSLPRQRLRLRNFIFMMRENQVLAARMQIETRSQLRHRHHRALNMPPGTPRPNCRLPRSLARLGRFPQREIARAVFFVFVDIHARAVFHAGKIFFRQLTVLRKPRDPKVIRPILRAVSNIFCL